MRNKSLVPVFFMLLAWCAGCSGLSDVKSGGGGSTTTVGITIAPSITSVIVGQTSGFTATVTGSTNTAVNWLVNGVAGGNATAGTINANGLFTAPATVPSPATVVVTAVAQADTTKSALASVQIIQSNNNQQAQNLPIKLGTSGGNSLDSSTQGSQIFCCSGTLGSLVSRNGSLYILSNNHVLARSDQASVGETITQPGLIDANCSVAATSTVADLTQFVNLETSGKNVDAAIALIVPGAVDTTGSILSLGSTATGSTADAGPPHQGNGILASIGENVAKSGRSSGLTCSTVDAVAIATSVSYQKGCNTGTSFNVNYTNQISVSGGAFSTGGDSGSLIVDQNTADPVALLYGGSDTDTVGNPVADVLAALADQNNIQPSFVGTASTHSVIGCTLAANGVKSAETQAAVAMGTQALPLAERARDLHAPELLANPYVQAIGVAQSIDNPAEAAVLLVVNPGQPPTVLPAQLEGVRTRVIAAGATAPHGIFEYSTGTRIAPVEDVFAVGAVSKAQMQAALVVHAAHASDLMKQPGVQGVGITSSADAPGEAALMIYLIRGQQHNAIPAVIDGLRTRVRVSSRFTAGRRSEEPVRGCQLPLRNNAVSKAGAQP
jgi:hypothetical protein